MNRFAPPTPRAFALRFGVAALVALASASRASAFELPPPAAGPVDYLRDVRPILAARCLDCHGPDRPKGDLRLDDPAAALKGGAEGIAVVPGKSAESPLILRVARSPDFPPMPPKGDPLTPAEVGVLRAWIDAGATGGVPEPSSTPAVPHAAEAASHWAFQPLVRPAPPDIDRPERARNAVDRFLLARLDDAGIEPAPEADRRALIRRLTFDLHGLPPAPEDIVAFENDPAPDAYERLVDRLLASPHYGERMARRWLDVVRFGETHGFDKDKPRDHAWPYRDYVVRAFSTDKPYADFVREQLAGDFLRPHAPDAVVATGFLAAGPWDFVGHVELREGTLEKERVRSLDRDEFLSATFSTFASLTVHCARCHDHKFDPIRREDYYALQAVFAGIDRGDRDYEDEATARLRSSLARTREELEAELAEAAKAGERFAGDPAVVALDARVLAARDRLARVETAAEGAASPANGYHSAIESSADPAVAKWVRIDLRECAPIDSIRLRPARPVDFPDTPGFGFPVRFRVEVSDDPDFPPAATRVVADRTDADFPNPGDEPATFEAGGVRGRFVRVAATRLWPRTNDYVFALAELEAISGGRNLAEGAEVAALDSIEAGRWSARHLTDGFDSRRRVRGASPFAASISSALRAGAEREIAEAAAERERAIDARLDEATRERIASARRRLDETLARLKSLPPPNTVYAVRSLEAPREIRVLARGDVARPLDEAPPATPVGIPGFDRPLGVSPEEPEGARRAALAEWIADPRNPLTWRSMANRVWGFAFGRPLVATPNDFGLFGAAPSHPELLDWIAAEFRDSGGSIKSLHRLLLTSAAYRRSSFADEASLAADPENRMLGRANRRRLSAEEFRDAALAASGALDPTPGGPSDRRFVFADDHSPRYEYAKYVWPERARRSIYAFAARSVPDPYLVALDCPDPNASVPARGETYGPLAALATFNDAFAFACAERFAERLEREAGEASVEAKLARAWELATGRRPSPADLSDLARHAERFGLPSACRVLLNLNEFAFLD